MMTASRFNYLIEITHKLIMAVIKMRNAYAGFPRLIDEEHSMIYSHTYTKRLEALCHEKTQLSEVITEAFEELQQLSQQVFTIWGDAECEGTAVYPGDLANCIKMLEGIHKVIVDRHRDLASSVLELQIAKFSEEFIAFKAQSLSIKPKIEMNRSALGGIVRSYQESTRVLFELCEQAQATYSPQGTQNKSATGTSTIVVRA
jgi:hypothetical protein